MKKTFLVVSLFNYCLANASYFNPFITEYNEKKCIETEAHHSKKMTYMEICMYREKGCLIIKDPKKNYFMHCVDKDINDCFKNESWKTINELVGIKKEIEVNRFSKTIFINNGSYSYQVCAHYNE